LFVLSDIAQDFSFYNFGVCRYLCIIITIILLSSWCHSNYDIASIGVTPVRTSYVSGVNTDAGHIYIIPQFSTFVNSLCINYDREFYTGTQHGKKKTPGLAQGHLLLAHRMVVTRAGHVLP
jgi:hypothetical protein